MARFDIGSLTPEGIQAFIDAEIEKRDIGQYVEWVRYVPEGQVQPENATHVLRLASVRNEVELTIAIKARGVYSSLVDAFLMVF